METCRKFNVPGLVSHGMGVLPQVIVKSAFSHAGRIFASVPSGCYIVPGVYRRQ